jgi:hypothetical protein
MVTNFVQATVPSSHRAAGGAAAFSWRYWLVLVATLIGSQASAQTLPAGVSESDWIGLQAAYEDYRHRVVATPDGFAALNPGQAWVTRFDGRGMHVHPSHGGWLWGLELSSYGWGKHRHTVDAPRSSRAAGGSMEYVWDARLTEWYRNGARGLEHGFTIASRPVLATADLTFVVSVRGGLQPAVDLSGRNVRFVNPQGDSILTYNGLKVFDALGRHLPARWHVADNTTLQLVVDDSQAMYPITVDPFVQQAYLKASNPDQSDQFGSSVAISGSVAVIGAHQEQGSSAGVNGNQADNNAPFAGAAYVFRRTGSVWAFSDYLKASNTGLGDNFGFSVAVDGNFIAIGAPGEDSNATGINGNQINNISGESGAVYVFARSGATWVQHAYIKASNTGDFDRFGASVAIEGDTLVVGANSEQSSATGVNGNQNNNSVFGAGAAYVFVRSGSTWTQQAYLKASNTQSSDSFGDSVAIDGDTIAVGATGEDSSATGVNGDQASNGAMSSGAVYVFVRSGTTWSQQAYIKASNTDSADRAGASLAISGDTLVVGAPFENGGGDGVNPDENDNSEPDAGAVYVFIRSGTIWSQQAYLKAGASRQAQLFGLTVDVDGSMLVVGAPLESGASTEIDCGEGDNSAPEAGAAYVFERVGTVWSPTGYLKSFNAESFDEFGVAVAVDAGTIIVGAQREDSGATGVDGNGADNSISASGAAYMFVFSSVVVCPPDLNRDCALDFFDLQSFLALFAQQDPAADWNSDTNFDFFDVQAYLTDFSAGCP